MVKRQVWRFDDLRPYLKIWATSSRLLDGRCPICGKKAKIDEKFIENALKRDLIWETLNFWITRYQKLAAIKRDFETGKIRTIVDLVNRVKQALSRSPVYRYLEAGNVVAIYVCGECGEKFSIDVNFRIDPRVFVSTETMFSWLEIFEKIKELGDKHLDYRLLKYFGAKYPELREKVLVNYRNGDYSLLVDLGIFLKRELGLRVDFWLPRRRLSPEKEAERREFWSEFDYRSATYVPAKS